MSASWKLGLLVVLFACVASWMIKSWTNEPFRPELVRNKVVCVCGASSGIGEELAYQYAKFGAKLVLAARRTEKLKAVGKRCEELGSPGTFVLTVDFANPNDTILLYQETMRVFQRIDIIILNHVQPNFGFYDDLTLTNTQIQSILEVNLLSYVRLAAMFAPHLHQSSGSIGIISSMAGVYGVAQAALYSLCKHGLHGFFSAYGIELKMKQMENVRITTCVLGPIATDMFLAALPPNATDAYGFPISPVADSATAIIEGVESKESIIYYPFYMKYFHYFSFMFPSVIDDLTIGEWKKQSLNTEA